MHLFAQAFNLVGALNILQNVSSIQVLLEIFTCKKRLFDDRTFGDNINTHSKRLLKSRFSDLPIIEGHNRDLIFKAGSRYG